MPASAETAEYRLNHTMVRVKDPQKSLHFYTEILGMDLIDEHDAGDFKLFFLAFPASPSANAASRAHREGILELTWNKGTEKDANQKYHNGNDQPQGFGHLCISVPDLQKACDRFTQMGVQFQKRPEDGKMRHIAFIKDPDSYWVEVISLNK
ncbi:unnamed protein product [Jaminaea pallidilutea]